MFDAEPWAGEIEQKVNRLTDAVARLVKILTGQRWIARDGAAPDLAGFLFFADGFERVAEIQQRFREIRLLVDRDLVAFGGEFVFAGRLAAADRGCRTARRERSPRAFSFWSKSQARL